MKIKDNRVKGIICFLCSAFCFATMNMFVRMAGDLPFMQKSLFRNLVALVVAFALLRKNGIPIKWKKGNGMGLFIRSAFGTAGILCNFFAIDHLVLADATMLNKMSPFFAVIFGFFILKEKVKLPQICFVGGAFLGSLLVIKPTFSNMDLLPSLVGLFGGMASGLAYTYVRKLTINGEKGPFVVFVFSAFSTLVTMPALIFGYQPMSLKQLIILMCAGLAATGGQFAITGAYSFAPAKEISVYDYSQILFAAALGFLAFGQVPDLLSWIGYGVICTMAIGMFLYNNRKQEA